MSTPTLQELVEQLAEIFVLADLTDSESKADVCAVIDQVQQHPASHSKVVEVAKAAYAELSQSLATDANRLAHAISLLDGCIRVMQEIVRDGRDPSKVILPEGVTNPPPAHSPLEVNFDSLLADFVLPDDTQSRNPSQPDPVSIEALLGQVDEVFAACTPTDLRQLATLHELLLTLCRRPELGNDVARSATSTADLVESLVLQDSGNPAADLQTVGQSLVGINKGFRGAGPDAVEVEDVAPPSQPTLQIQLPAAVDEGMLADFLGRQQGCLEEFEGVLLGPRGTDEEAMDQIRRFLHTLKGEAGLLGLDAVQGLCHHAEDKLSERPLAELREALLEAKDWLQTYFRACAGQSPPPPPPRQLSLYKVAMALPKPPASLVHDPLEDMEIGDTSNLFVDADESLLQDFVGESLEHLEAADQHLLELEHDPGNRERLDAVFRAFHTIKGVSSFLGLTMIQRLAHEAENLLDGLRKGTLRGTPPVVDTVFKAIDALKTMISSGAYPPGGAALRDLMRLIRCVRENEGQAEVAAVAQPSAAREASESVAETAVEGGGSVVVRETLKVDAQRLDKLIDIIGELVIAEAMVSQSLADISGLTMQKRNQSQISKITRELQEIGMSLRMVPVRPTFQKMARIVHDLARKEKKEVRFAMSGEDTELDKTVVDHIGDPLLHMVRNAVDHGIEDSPADRIAAGKPAEATIELKAYHQGGYIYICISDDGRGLNKDAILDKALRVGLVQPDQQLSDRELYMLIFEPGFSTRQVATDVSGRGVGMDVVKRNIDALRGRVDVQTTCGKGTTFTLKLPLTLAIIEGMLVRVGAERYVIPTMSIVRTVSIKPEALKTALHREEMLKDGDRMLPLFRLAELFDVGSDRKKGGGTLAVLVETEGRRAAVVVDELLGQEQIVLKSLGHAMRGIPGISGGAILPDGQVGLIIDVAGLLQLAQCEEAEAELVRNGA